MPQDWRALAESLTEENLLLRLKGNEGRQNAQRTREPGTLGEPNYATAGAGIFIHRAAPTIGGADPSESTEITCNVAGHHIAPEDAKYFPSTMLEWARAGLLAFGGGVASAGNCVFGGPVLRNLPIRDNHLAAPPDLRAFIPLTSGIASPLTVFTPPGSYVIGGGVALIELRASYSL